MIADLCGVEFDWFAFDIKGNVGLFSTAGHGYVPREIHAVYDEYYQLTNDFDLPNFGSTKIWKDYAIYGFHVYDWQLYHGPYKKMENPIQKISKELKSKILRLSYVPILSIDFNILDKVDINLFV